MFFTGARVKELIKLGVALFYRTVPYLHMEKVMTELCRRNLVKGRLRPRIWDQNSVICMDIVDFTRASNGMVSEKLCNMLIRFYAKMDELSGEHNVDKVDIVGDAYIAMASSAVDAVRFCLGAFDLAKSTMWDENDASEGCVMLRCAVNTGKVTGLVLNTVSFKYTLVGDTFQVARKLESEAVPGRVHCSAATVAFLDDKEFHVICQAAMHPSSYSVTPGSLDYKTVVCPTSLRFFSVSNAFVELFGFKPRELLTLRMVFGPLTRNSAVYHALEQCYQFDCCTKTAVVLYTRLAVPKCVSIVVERGVDVLMGVAIECTVLDSTPGPRERTGI